MSGPNNVNTNYTGIDQEYGIDQEEAAEALGYSVSTEINRNREEEEEISILQRNFTQKAKETKKTKPAINAKDAGAEWVSTSTQPSNSSDAKMVALISLLETVDDKVTWAQNLSAKITKMMSGDGDPRHISGDPVAIPGGEEASQINHLQGDNTQLQTLKDNFSRIDTDGDGLVSKRELSKWNHDHPDNKIKSKMISEYGSDGKISVAQIDSGTSSNGSSITGLQNSIAGWNDVRLFDKDGDSKLSYGEYQAAIAELSDIAEDYGKWAGMGVTVLDDSDRLVGTVVKQDM